MHFRQPLQVIGHFFIALAFLLKPVVDHMHAVKMLGGATADLQSIASSMPSTTIKTSPSPCHEATMASTELASPDLVTATHADDDRHSCCPYDECSPDNCLMQVAMASVSAFEILPHSRPDQRSFLLMAISPAPMPFTERLRPPIA